MNIDLIKNRREKKRLLFIKMSGLLFSMLVLIFTAGCVGNVNHDVDIVPDETQNQETPVKELEKDTVKYGDDGVNAGIAPDDGDVTIVSNQDNAQSQSMVAMSVEDMGRSDPFLPYGEISMSSANLKKQNKPLPPKDLLPPPEIVTTDETATEVITTKVSGILYDKYNPSAILNINNSDYLVRTGDIVNNYKVLSIAKDYVTVQYGANVYKAGVGELFTGEGINFNAVSNLDRKFGGARNLMKK